MGLARDKAVWRLYSPGGKRSNCLLTPIRIVANDNCLAIAVAEPLHLGLTYTIHLVP